MPTYKFEASKEGCETVKHEAWAGKFGSAHVKFLALPNGNVNLYVTSSSVIVTLMFEPEEISAFLAEGVVAMHSSPKDNVIPMRRR